MFSTPRPARVRALHSACIPLIALIFTSPVSLAVEYLGQFSPYQPGTTEYWRLQDFCIFEHDGYTYVASMNKTDANRIILGRSADFENWEYLGEALEPPRSADDSGMVWAPHVVEDNGTFHMFYTGVVIPAAGQWNQRILIASTTTPHLPHTWARNQTVDFIVDGQSQSWFRPSHTGSVWNPNGWADSRDPMVMEHDGTWYMFYSGADTSGGICGVATAPSVLGPWTDQGAVLQVNAGIPESCFVIPAPDGSWVMTLNHASTDPQVRGIKTARGSSLVPVNGQPPFSDLRLLAPTMNGWAHEFLPGPEAGTFLCAHLTGYWVNLRWAYTLEESYGWTVIGADVPEDNCPRVINPDQIDSDGDSYGDACDACSNSFPGAPVGEDGCLPAVPGDFDRDGDVDLVDFGQLQTCLSGAGIPQNLPHCIDARLDGDSDVDNDDLNLLLNCLTGSNQVPDPTCAN